jgi:zinc D-Ala-D-Ala carboxypeptidase
MVERLQKTKSMKISENITLLEATKSQTAIRDGIDNTPNETQLACMVLVSEKIYEPVKKACSGAFISSFFRCEKLNKKIGGAKGSQHEKGEAMDIDSNGFNNEIFHYVKNNLVFDQLLWEFGDTNEPAWVHVSYKVGGNRKQILRAIKENGKTKYIPFDL